jgi:dTDP-glucose 4,6-dehydratase
MRLLVTGGYGFIGSALIRWCLKHTDYEILNIDALSYAASQESIPSSEHVKRYTFVKADINDSRAVDSAIFKFMPDRIIHLAAESHVDNSISSPAPFINTNIVGTYTLLESARRYWLSLSGREKVQFRFHHVSTDEVYGSCESDGFFTEETPYKPNSPYSASKASSDHLVRAWNVTFGLPTLITNCSNNYGPFQFPEKLIPLVIRRAISGEAIPVYGAGHQVRDWLHVDDHVQGLLCVLSNGKVGDTYNIGGSNERKNIDVVKLICSILDSKYCHFLKIPNTSFASLITHVEDRPGHDQRYAIDATKIKDDLGWHPNIDFLVGLEETVDWYVSNLAWANSSLGGDL